MTKSANDNMMTRPHKTDAGRPACMEKDRNTEFDNRVGLFTFGVDAFR